MKEDKDLGIKVTENEEETLWHTQLKALEQEQSNLKKLIKINDAFIEKTKEMLEKAKK